MMLHHTLDYTEVFYLTKCGWNNSLPVNSTLNMKRCWNY